MSKNPRKYITGELDVNLARAYFAIRAELAAIKAQAEDATEYVLAVENRELRAEVERLKKDNAADWSALELCRKVKDKLRAELAQAREEIERLRRMDECPACRDGVPHSQTPLCHIGPGPRWGDGSAWIPEAVLAAEKAARASDAEVFRGQLGYAVQEGCAATLQDGTLPDNVLAKSIKQYWESERAARERAEARVKEVEAEQADDTSLIVRQNATIARQEEEMIRAQEDLLETRKALKRLYNETADYITVNHLGDPEHNFAMKNAGTLLRRHEVLLEARAALSKPEPGR